MMANRQDNIDQILQMCLEMIQNGQASLDEVLEQYPDQADVLRPELEVAIWLQKRSQAMEPRPGFLSASQRRLIESIEQEGAAAQSTRPETWRIFPWLAEVLAPRRLAWQLVVAIILVLCLFTGGSGVALASQNALPGDRLYPVKTALEQASLALTPSPAGEVRLHIEFANRRLEEIRSLSLKGRGQYIGIAAKNFESQIHQALKTMDELVTKDPEQAKALASQLERTLARQNPVMAQLAESAPEQTRPEFELVLQASAQGMAAAQQVLLLTSGKPEGTVLPEASDTPDQAAVPPTVPPTIPFPTVPITVTPHPLPTETFGILILPLPTHRPTDVPVITSTLTTTVTLEAKDTEEPTRPVKRPKPSKTPKPKKTKTPRPPNKR